MTDIDYKLTCPENEATGEHEWKKKRVEDGVTKEMVCERCGCRAILPWNAIPYANELNAAARHIAGLEKRIAFADRERVVVCEAVSMAIGKEGWEGHLFDAATLIGAAIRKRGETIAGLEKENEGLKGECLRLSNLLSMEVRAGAQARSELAMIKAVEELP